ncbi:hypothetical protein NEOC95_002275 [Neochlamydia sp. AcF95]|nr:hypothetical protein [Neochlamydia sp. AcF95]
MKNTQDKKLALLQQLSQKVELLAYLFCLKN